MVGYKIGVLTEPIARTFDLDDNGVMEQPVKEGGGDNGIAEDLAPFCEAAVRGEDNGAFLVSCIDELEEQIAAAGNDRQVTDFVDDKQREAAKEPDLIAQGALALGFGERADEITEWREVDATAGLDGLDAERERQMALASPRRAKDSILCAVRRAVLSHAGVPLSESHFKQGHPRTALES